MFHWERNKEKNYYSDVKNSQGRRLNGRRTGNAGWWNEARFLSRHADERSLAARQTQLHRSALSTRQACTEKYSFCYICHLRLRIELMFLLFYELWLKHNQTVAPTLNGSLTTTAKRLIRSPMQSRRLKLHLTAAFVTMAQMCNVKELTWWVTTHSSHLYSMF